MVAATSISPHRFDLVVNCAADQIFASNISTSSQRSFCTRSPRTARSDCGNTAAFDPLHNETRLPFLLDRSGHPSLSKSGIKCSHILKLCSSDPPSTRTQIPGLCSRSNNVAAAASRVFPPPRGAHTTKSSPGSRYALQR